MSHNARSSHVFNTRYSLTIKMHHKKYHWMGIVQAIIPRLQIELTIGELVPFQNHAGLRGWTRTGRPYPAFHEIRKSSTCGFDFTDYGMPEGSRPGPVNRHGFEIAGWAGARLVPIMGLVPAGWPLGGWRPAPRKRKNGGRRDSRCPKGAGEWSAATPPPAGRAPASRIGRRGPLAPEPVPHPRPRRRKIFPKLSLHRRPSSRIVLLRTGA